MSLAFVAGFSLPFLPFLAPDLGSEDIIPPRLKGRGDRRVVMRVGWSGKSTFSRRH